MEKVIGFLPLRAGSKSIPGKNKRLFLGKPLFYYQLSALLQCGDIDEVFVYTDDEEILIDIEENWSHTRVLGVHRDPKDAEDSSSTEDAMINFITSTSQEGETLFVLAQATNPFITSLDYSKAISQARETDSAVLSVSVADRFFWEERKDSAYSINYSPAYRPRRQTFGENSSYNQLYVENGGFYINRVSRIVPYRNRLGGSAIKLYVMDSWTSVEIDEELDWDIAEMIFKGKMSHE